MTISEVRVFLRNEEKLKAFVTASFDGVIAVHNMKIVQGQKGLILCMPSRKGMDGKFRDVVHPITKEFRQQMEQAVLAVYEQEVKKLSATVPAAPATPPPAQ